jgi:hypothetical protein
MTASRKRDDVRRRRGAASGVTSIEFVLVASFYFIPMILGTMGIGFNLVRAMQAIEITRDAGHMYAKGVDFSQQANQNLVVNQMGAPLNLQGNGGNVTGGTAGSGVIILSTMTYVGTAQCTSCANLNHYVVSRRIVIGNNTLYTSGYGSGMTIDATSGDVQNYTTDTHARADTFASLLSLTGGQTAYFVESDFVAPGLSIPGLTSQMGTYNYAIF